MGSVMGKPHPIKMHNRIAAIVVEGNSHREATAHFHVSKTKVNDVVRFKREPGALDPKSQGKGGWNKLDPCDDRTQQRIVEQFGVVWGVTQMLLKPVRLALTNKDQSRLLNLNL